MLDCVGIGTASLAGNVKHGNVHGPHQTRFRPTLTIYVKRYSVQSIARRLNKVHLSNARQRMSSPPEAKFPVFRDYGLPTKMSNNPDPRFNTIWTHPTVSGGENGTAIAGMRTQYSIKGGDGYGGKGRGDYSRGGDARGGDARALQAQGGDGRGGDGLGEYAVGGHARGGQAMGRAAKGGHGEGGHGVAASSRGGDGNGGDAAGHESQGGLGRGGHGFGWDTLGGSGFGGEAVGLGAAGGVGEGADGYFDGGDSAENDDGGLVLGGRPVGEGDLRDLRSRRLAVIQSPLQS